jgi:hypothetical protein
MILGPRSQAPAALASPSLLNTANLLRVAFTVWRQLSRSSLFTVYGLASAIWFLSLHGSGLGVLGVQMMPISSIFVFETRYSWLEIVEGLGVMV